ncbi:MAG: TIGR01621 family pseudouridine synthase [Sulfurimonadaceae bacterium]|nr:TIGR01621 family pseudouridine synthase [Sulfurimonadaceae bacterium]
MRALECVFENGAFALFDKPAGMNFHSEEEAGMVVRAEAMLECKLYPVHRLDKMTSGLVILAKSSEAAAVFNTLFSQRRIEKYYLAISLRKPKKKQGWVKGDMLSARRGDWKLATTMENPAVTRFLSASLRPHERLFLVRPFTGKTHQIRVALKAVGSPIAGDLRYARSEEAKKEERGYLHAYALRFEYEGETFAFVQPPKEGERFLSSECTDQLTVWDEPWEAGL